MIKLSKGKLPGKLIVFEGTDGAGKTTMIARAERYLRERYGAEVLLQKQPTDLSRKTKLFQKMMYCAHHEEIDYRAVQLLTLSDRVQHNHEVIPPALREGKVVICDRYLYTSVANMRARGYWRERWFFAAARSIRKPDLTFLVLRAARLRDRADPQPPGGMQPPSERGAAFRSRGRISEAEKKRGLYADRHGDGRRTRVRLRPGKIG